MPHLFLDPTLNLICPQLKFTWFSNDIYIEESEDKMGNNKKDNRILEVIIVKGIKYIKDALNSRLITSQLALRGSKVNLVSCKTLAVKTGSGFYA